MARNRPPSFDFYPEDFLAGTMHLHPFCIGVYIRLLCFQWAHGSIPADERQLIQITGAMPDELAEHLPTVLEKFELGDDGRYRNARMERERSRKSLVSQRRAEAANHRWNGRNSDGDSTPSDANADAIACAKADANGDAKGMPPIRKLEVGRRKKEEGINTGERKGVQGETIGDWQVPESLDCPEVRTLLSDFELMRRRIGKPLRDRGRASCTLRHFDSAEHLRYALEFCIANDYQGLKPEYRPPRNGNGAIGHSQPKTFDQIRVDETQAVARRFAQHGPTDNF